MTGHKLRAADLVARRLYEAGCRFAFGMPGGEVLTLVDAAAAPLLMRNAWLEVVDPALALLSHGHRGHLERVARWQEALLALSAVQRSLPQEAGRLWLAYLRGRGSPGRHQEPSLLARRVGDRDIALPGLPDAA